MEQPKKDLKSEREAVNKLVSFLLDLHRNEILTPMKVWTWETAVSGLSDAQILNGMKRYIMEAKSGFFPMPATFVELCKNEAGSTQNSRAELAWVEVERTVRIKGSTTAICFADSAITQAIKALCGWVRICADLNETSKPFIKKEFIEIYKGLSSMKMENEILEGRDTRQEIDCNRLVMINYVGEFVDGEQVVLLESLKNDRVLLTDRDVKLIRE